MSTNSVLSSNKNKRHKRYGLLTFAHGTMYGLQLLQTEIDFYQSAGKLVSSTDIVADRKHVNTAAATTQYDKLSVVECDEDTPTPSDTNSCISRCSCSWSCAACITCQKCALLRPYALSIMGLFQIIPEVIMIFQQRSNAILIYVSFVAWCLSTLTALLYFARFLYHYCYRQTYKFSSVDDTQSEQIDADPFMERLYSLQDLDMELDAANTNYNTNTVELVVGNTHTKQRQAPHIKTFVPALSVVPDDADEEIKHGCNDDMNIEEYFFAELQPLSLPANDVSQPQIMAVDENNNDDELTILTTETLHSNDKLSVDRNYSNNADDKHYCHALSPSHHNRIRRMALSEYSKRFFHSLSAFMGALLLFNAVLGVWIFMYQLYTVHEAEHNMVPGVLFVLFAYPFIGATMCFIELQQMNELLTSTSSVDDDHDNILSRHSSFWYLYGFVVNHFPMLYFMFKVAAFFSVSHLWLYNLLEPTPLGTDDEVTVEIGGTDDGDNLWFSVMFTILATWLFVYEPEFVRIVLDGYYNHYPPIFNSNIERVRPEIKDCPTQWLETIKMYLLLLIDCLLPYSYIIEMLLILGNAVGFLLYFAVWDRYVAPDGPQYDYTFGSWSFTTICIVQIMVVLYAIGGERCCYALGDELVCNALFDCRRGRRSRRGGCCKYDCVWHCTRQCQFRSYKTRVFCPLQCWCLYCPGFSLFCCPQCAVSPDYKQRFMTFLESLLLLLKLLHYYTFSSLNNAWYDIVFAVLIFVSCITLFLLGLAAAYRSVLGLEVASIMNSAALFCATYLLSYAFVQFVVYANFIFTMTYDHIERLDHVSVFMIFVWIVMANVYSKEYRSFTKQIERDFIVKNEGINLKAFDRKWQLPPMMGSLFHLSQLMVVFCVAVIIFYLMRIHETLAERGENWTLERNVCIVNMMLTLLMLLIAILTLWSMSLSTTKLRQLNDCKQERNGAFQKTLTVYRDLPGS